MGNMTRKEVEAVRRKSLVMFLMVGGLVFLYMTFSFFFGDMGLVKLLHMRETRQGLEAEIKALNVENAALKKEVESLKNDPAKIESVAREKLGMAKKGEIVYQYEKNSEAAR